MKARFINFFISLSQCLHMLLTLGNGDPKMTTSARIGRHVARGERWAIYVCRVISAILFDPGHCLSAYKKDRARRLCGGSHDE